MKKLLFFFVLLSSTFVFTDDLANAWSNLITKVNQIGSFGSEIKNLYTVVQADNDQKASLQADLDTLNAEIAEAEEQQKEIEDQQIIEAAEAEVMLRGRINSIINNTDTDFSVEYPDGTRVALAAQSTVALNKAFSEYKRGSAIGGIISIIPQVNGEDISSSDAEALAVGLSYSLMFNVQGLNQPGYPFGRLGCVAVTRDHEAGGTRSHGVSPAGKAPSDSANEDSSSALTDEDTLWGLDVLLNYVPGLGDGKTFIYPRISTFYTTKYDPNDLTTAPDVASVTEWSSQVPITESNSCSDLCYPLFSGTVSDQYPSCSKDVSDSNSDVYCTGDLSKMWGDVVSAT